MGVGWSQHAATCQRASCDAHKSVIIVKTCLRRTVVAPEHPFTCNGVPDVAAACVARQWLFPVRHFRAWAQCSALMLT